MKLIGRFNRLIRNRILWTVLIVVISIMFVGYFSKGGGCVPDDSRRNAVGRIFGEQVSAREFAQARYFALGLRKTGAFPEEIEERVRKAVWGRIAALKTAAKLGITVSGAEVAETIRTDPAFAADGRFDRRRYRAVLQQRIGSPSSVNTVEHLYDQYIRESLVVAKLRRTLEWCVWTPAERLRRMLSNLTDVFSVEYTILKRGELEAEADLSREDIRAYYEENLESFREPETIKVQYTAFPISNYIDKVSVSSEEAVLYYTNNLEQFTEEGTNGEYNLIPYTSVGADITNRVRNRKAAFLAKDDATELVVSLAPDDYGRAPALERVLADRALAVRTTAWFSASQPLEEPAAGPAFNEAAFALVPDDPERYFSDAVQGADAAYVLFAGERRDSRLPEFTNIAKDVTLRAEAEAESRLFYEKCRDLRTSISESVEGGQTFRQAVENYGFNIHTQTYSAYTADPEQIEYYETLVTSVTSLNEGEISEVTSVPDGAILVYVASREPAPSIATEFTRAQLASEVDRYKASLLFQDWKDHILAQSDLEVFSKQKAPAAE
ncbi:MAG: SurA N-terminal domain-containing protein [Kiritimatiellia bacterium]